jgi:hypothetical protein
MVTGCNTISLDSPLTRQPASQVHDLILTSHFLLPEFMYGLPKDVDLRFLNGIELQQICIGLHDVILNFTDQVTITVQTRFIHKSCLQFSGKEEVIPLSACTLPTLLGKQITSFTNEINGTLVLTFSNGETLTLVDDSPDYESYVITHSDQIIVV